MSDSVRPLDTHIQPQASEAVDNGHLRLVGDFSHRPSTQGPQNFERQLAQATPGFTLPPLTVVENPIKPHAAQEKAQPWNLAQVHRDAPQTRDQVKQASDGLVPLAPIEPQAAKAYLHGDGKGLPPIARDFRQLGLNSLREKEARDQLKPQVHVSTRPGDRNFPLGSEQNPYTSIQSAVDRAPRGSVINVHRQGNDTYKETVSINRSDIVLTTDRNNPAIIDLAGKRPSKDTPAISIGSGVHDVDVKNFEIRNFSGQSAGIRVDGANINNITIAGNNVHSAKGAEGIGVYGRGATEQSKLTNINLISNQVHDLKLGQLEAMPVNGNVSGFKVIGNSGYKLDNIFIDAIGGEKSSNNPALDQARNGLIEYNYAKGITTVNNSEYGQFSAAAIYTDAAKDVAIRNNYIVASDFGIEVGSEHRGMSSTGVSVTGNVVENSNYVWLGRGGDIKRPGGAEDSFARNNVAIGNTETELQANVKNFPVDKNAGFKNIDSTRLLPAPIANRARAFAL
ncbi:MAG: hypothetical protein JST01_25245 [Cyanobacteria bacterium SZAS TMP-1]|nr:hypothetical protein [Cyanobacteria bacterium SZAS TMP-1]